MARLSLTMACGDYDRSRPLIEGKVQAEGVSLTVVPMSDDGERHRRFLEEQAFDICEFSLALYLAGRGLGMPFTALPIFPNRQFRHSFIYINSQAGIREPKDLVGKRVGVRNHLNTAALWVRGMLQHDHQIPLDRITWVPSSAEPLAAWQPPAWLSLQPARPDQPLEELLVAGAIDALIVPSIIAPLRQGSPVVKRLFPNYPEVERDYLKRTGIFPISHALVMRQELLDQHPWLARSLMTAWEKAKAQCFERLKHPGSVSLIWGRALWEEQLGLVGPDPWPYGLQANQPTLQAALRYAVDQGLFPAPVPLEALFQLPVT